MLVPRLRVGAARAGLRVGWRASVAVPRTEVGLRCLSAVADSDDGDAKALRRSRIAALLKSQLWPSGEPSRSVAGQIGAAPSAEEAGRWELVRQSAAPTLWAYAHARRALDDDAGAPEREQVALRLQQEEHAAFMSAVRSPTGSAPSGATPAMHAMDISDATSPPADTDADESLQLAIRLQQEELNWHQMGVANGDEQAIDEDMRQSMELAMQLSAASPPAVEDL